MKKRLFKPAILLLIICLAAGLFACSTAKNGGGAETTDANANPDVNATDNIPATTAKEVIPPLDLPVENFNGRNFNVVTYPFDMTTQFYRMFSATEENGDLINDACYKRTVAIEEKYNVKINQITKSTGPAQAAKKSVKAGTDDYNLVVEIGWAGFPLANEGLVVNMYDIPYISEAMAENKPWWDAALARDMTINGKLYFNAGDMIMCDDILVYVILFNKELFTNNALEYPYKYVCDGTWTYDKMFELTRGLNKDITGDGLLDQFDQWGIMGEYHSSGRLFQSSGQTSIKIGDDGYPYFALEDPRAIDVMNKLMPYIVDGQSMFLAENIKKPKTESVYSEMGAYFQEDRIFMWLATLGNVTSANLRAMPTDFGIIPTPKYNEFQDKYYTFVEMSAGMISVPISTDAEFTGLIAEALAYESVSTLTPAFYDLTLRTKTARDDESEEMLDIIFNNKIYDLGTFNTNFLVHDIFPEAVSKHNGNMMSVIEARRDKINIAIEKFNQNY